MKKLELKQKDISPGKSYIRICKILYQNLRFLGYFLSYYNIIITKWKYLSQQRAMQSQLGAPKHLQRLLLGSFTRPNPPGLTRISPNSGGEKKYWAKGESSGCRGSQSARFTGWCVCVLGLGWGVGAGPNVFIAPMKRPENPNKSKTQTRTKATERGWSLLLRAPRFVCC